MNKLLLVCGLSVAVGAFAGCSKKRVAECDDFVKTAEKLANCDKLPKEQRDMVAKQAGVMKDTLKQVDELGGWDQAPKDLVDEMRNACKTQNDKIVEEMSKAFPECVK